MLPSRAQKFWVSSMQPPAEHFRSSSALCALCAIQTGLSYVRTHHEWEQPPYGVTQWICLWRKCKCRDVLTNWSIFLSFISAGLYTPWKVIKNYPIHSSTTKILKIFLKKLSKYSFFANMPWLYWKVLKGSRLPMVNKYLPLKDGGDSSGYSYFLWLRKKDFTSLSTTLVSNLI